MALCMDSLGSSIDPSLRARHPDAPWLWREDWASGRIESSHGGLALVSWLFAVVFSAFTVPLLWKAPEVAQRDGALFWVAAGAFAAASLGLLWWAIRSTLRWRRFPRLVLRLPAIPGVVGGRLGGTVELPTTLSPERGFVLRLSCLRRRRSGKKTKEDTVWQEEIVVPTARAMRGPSGTVVPVGFEIPFEAEPSSADPSRLPAVRWRLEILARVPGADLHGLFEVPVFKTAESSETITERVHVAPSGAEGGAWEAAGGPLVIGDPSILVTPLTDSTTAVELHLPASRNRAGALALTFFTALWNGFILWAGSMAPGLFKLTLLPFVLIGLLLAVFVPVAWLQSTTLRARPRELTIHRRLLGLGRPQTIPASEIESFAPVAKGSNGGKASFSVRLRRVGRKPALLASNLRSKADAETIARMLQRGVQS